MTAFLFSLGFSVFAGVGERTREGNDLLREMIESGVINYGEEFLKGMEEGKRPIYRMPIFIASALCYLNDVLLPEVSNQLR